MAERTAYVVIALVLAFALFWMLTRLFVPLARALWVSQVRAVEARMRVLQGLRLPRSHRRPKFGRAA